MSRFFYFLILVFVVSSCDQSAVKTSSSETPPESVTTKRPDYAIAIHGGAGTILKKNMTEEKETAIRQSLEEALQAGVRVLENGGAALDAVEATIMVLENAPHFNAGKGAVFTNHETNELDASIMDGKTLNAGAVSGITTIKNPILAARAVMEQSDHVLLSGQGAEEFAQKAGLETVDPAYFKTEHRWEALQRAKSRELEPATGAILFPGEDDDWKYGTVGCVVLDKAGNLAAGTSTGGMTNKRYNRIGDSPIIGAGCYANNETCAISSTGHGEYFIRYGVAFDVSARMAYLGEDVATASNHVINKKLLDAGGSGGIIALDHNGNISMPFNTEGMYRGYAKPGELKVEIYKP